MISFIWIIWAILVYLGFIGTFRVNFDSRRERVIDDSTFDKYKRKICFFKDESQCNPEDVKTDMVLRKINIEIELFLEEKEN